MQVAWIVEGSISLQASGNVFWTIEGSILSEVVEEVSSSSSSSSSSGLDLVVVDVEPVILTISPIALTSFLQVNTGTVQATISAVAPNLQLQTNSSPVTLTLSTVAPTTLIQCNLTPVTTTIAVVSPGGETTIDVEPVTLTLSTISPLLEKLYNQTPVTLTLEVVSPNLQLQSNQEPIDLILSTVTLTTLLQANVNPLQLLITVVAVEIDGGTPIIPPSIVTTVVHEAKPNLFAAFNDRFKFINPIVSEFVLEDTQFPYISLGQVYNILAWKNSCLQRFEESQYDLKIYTESFDELEQKIKEIEDTLQYDNLLLTNPKQVISLAQITKETEEVKRELYRCIIGYQIIVQRDIDPTYLSSPTSGETLNKCIFERSKLLKLHNNAFVSPGYVLENTALPYIYVPKINEYPEWFHSKGRVDKVTYPITIKSEDLNELLDMMDEVESVFDYAKFEIDDKEHLINEWVGTEIVELEPQLYCGKINYEILVESTVLSYGNH